MDTNNEESLSLLYKVTRICKKKDTIDCSFKKMCYNEDTGCKSMRKVLILRYIYSFSSKNIDFIYIEKMFLYPQYYELIWLIIKCTIMIMCNILDIEL